MPRRKLTADDRKHRWPPGPPNDACFSVRVPEKMYDDLCRIADQRNCKLADLLKSAVSRLIMEAVL